MLRKKHKFFEKRAKDIYIQENFHTYFTQKDDIFNETNKVYEIERYLKLRNFNHRNAITKLRLFSNSLSNNLGKWYKTSDDKKVCKFCTMGNIENEEHITFECHRYNDIRTDTFNSITIRDHIDLNGSNRKENLSLLFLKGSLKSLKSFGELIYNIFEIREKLDNELVSYTIFL